MPVLTDWAVEIARDDVLRAQQADPEKVVQRRPGLASMTEEAALHAQGLLELVVIFERRRVLDVDRERLVLEGQFTIQSRLLARLLARSEEVVAAACTIGDAVERLASEAMAQGRYAQGYAYDSAGLVGLENLVKLFYQEVEAQAAMVGKSLSHRFSPGLKSWPVTQGQPEIFSLLGDTRPQIELLPSLQMRPTKSVSFIIGIGENVVRRGTPCDFCGMRSTCAFRTGRDTAIKPRCK